LEDPAFLLKSVTFDDTAPSSQLKAQVVLSYVDSVNSLSNPVTFQALLVESDIVVDGSPDLRKNVVRKFLFNTEGLTTTKTWNETEEQILDIDYTMSVPINDPENLYLVIFAQDKKTTRILQSSIVKAPMKEGVQPVGTIEDPALAEIKDINLYPNPASKVVNFHLGRSTTKEYTWSIVDQRGVTMSQGKVERDLSIPQQVDVKNLANGVYFVQFALGDKTVLYKKLVVMNSGN
jgi:hypothetical protein